MAGINVNITDVATNATRSAELPGDIPMTRLIPALTSRLGLPITGPNGEPMSYRLQTEDGRMLNEDETLSSAGVQEGANMTLTAEMEAGK